MPSVCYNKSNLNLAMGGCFFDVSVCKFKKQTKPKKQSNSNQCGCFFGAFYYSGLPDTDYLGRWIVIIVCAETMRGLGSTHPSGAILWKRYKA